MSVPSMVHRSGKGGNLAVRSDALYEPADDVPVDGDDDDDDAGEDAVVRPAASNETTSIVADDDQRSKELPDCKVRRNYTCPSCEFFTQNPRVYLYHLRDVHNQKIKVYECPTCLYASKHFQKLLRHSKMVHGTSDGVNAAETSRKSRKRSVAEEPSDVPQVLQDNHLEDDVVDEMLPQDPDRPVLFKCSVCAFTSRNRVQLSKHEREEHIKTKFFRCSKCTYVTHIKARYTKHVKYHSMPMIKCDMCDFRTPYKWNLDRHSKNHNGKGAFRCSACNFTADIKQSLTVHEMNHHVPPVGQAAGLGVGRRRNKVGASDTTAAEEAAASSGQQQEPSSIVPPAVIVPEASKAVTVPEASKAEPPPRTGPKIKITPKKSKVSSSASRKGETGGPRQGKGSDFIHPDDIIQHSNGKVYIKNKCKLCNFKTAWDSEMAKHEKLFHNIDRELTDKSVVKKTSRPIPNLIPIPSAAVLKFAQQRFPAFKVTDIPDESKEPVMSQKDINDICSRSANSELKDFASLFGSEDVFKNPSTSKVPDLIPKSIFASANRNRNIDFRQKNASFFDRLKEKLEIGTGCNLICNLCGHESKCLTEQAKHQKACGKEVSKVPSIIPVHNISASRCQYCRQRCKSSADLFIHMQSCPEVLKFHSEEFKHEDDTSSEHENELKIDEDRQSIEEDIEGKPHPMENKVFVWNDIMVPMDIEVDDSNYEYTEDKIDDNVSLDLSIRTQSPACSENSYVGQENNNNINTNNNHPVSVQHSPVQTTTEKIPTHGNDISVAQHKRVFKCPHCTFWASTASRFHVHIVGHLNKKPFECSLCSYRSNWRWDITKHIKLKSVRDQAHESAKVLMTDETGRRNYTKYNKYLTEIPLSSLQSSNETSGGCGTRPKNYDKNPSPSTSKPEKERNKLQTTGDLSSLLKASSLRPPPALKAADKHLLASVSQEKKKSNSESKRTLFKCKKCNFRDSSRDILLQHVKGHYQQQLDQEQQFFQQAVVAAAAQVTMTPTSSLPHVQQISGAGAGAASAVSFSSQDLSLRGTSPDRDEASVNNSSATKGSSTTTTCAPFRCGHCNQVSNWKHVIQRHCRLKHSGDIRVISTKNGQEKVEIEEQLDDPDDIDLQSGAYKCNICPYATDNQNEFQQHLPGHLLQSETSFKCVFCKYGVSQEEDLLDHLKLHALNLNDPEGKKFRCGVCPYVTNSKSQYTYHRQFHKARGGQYTCTHCSYNVSKRHLLHQHLKVHGINLSPSKQNGDIIEIDETNDEIDEVPSKYPSTDSAQFSEIPLVWVSKNGKFTKMFKCRYCPHVNLRKVNIHEHEKMHSTREKNPNSTRVNDVEHRCSECNYICNNAGVLSSHTKVHQGLYGIVHCLVDFNKSDDEQIRELTKALGSAIEGLDTSDFLEVEMEEMDSPTENTLLFCEDCPARFLKENEFSIHRKFHNSDLEYRCDFCTFAADNNAYLLSHLKVHTGDYQDRTKVLASFHTTSSNHPKPNVRQKVGPNGELAWGVDNSGKSEIERKNNILASFLSKPLKSSHTVPLSGTDLFQQRSEANQRQATESTQLENLPGDVHVQSRKSPIEQFGDFINGNPDFIYQTYIKNGRTKQKRYKCHKCPSAFEKREQYKIHLGLHGSQQRYNCEYCDYSVKYYANYVQHLKKHKFNEDAQAAKKSAADVSEEYEEINESMEVTAESSNPEEFDGEGEHPKVSVADQQMLEILQHQQNKPNCNLPSDEKKLHWCPHCPYTNGRKDALENHLKRHQNVSGVKSTYACDHCDYSVPQAHFLRDHTKLHFIPNNQNHVNGYMICDNYKLTSKKIQASTVEEENEHVIFDEQETKLEPSDDEKFNNNKGEKQLNNVQKGYLVDKDVSDLKVKQINFQTEVN